jgi:hypothetical protein
VIEEGGVVGSCKSQTTSEASKIVPVQTRGTFGKNKHNWKPIFGDGKNQMSTRKAQLFGL